MKIKLSYLRKVIREELLKEAMPAATQDFHQSNLQQGFQALVNSFPNVLTNQIIVQKMNGASMDNRAANAAAATTKEYVDQAAKTFAADLQTVIEKHFVQGVKNFKAPAQAPQAAPQAPATGNAPDQRQTMMPPPNA